LILDDSCAWNGAGFSITMRLTFAIVTGYLVFAFSAALLFQLSGHDPHAAPGIGFAVLGILWGIAFAALGGYVAVITSRRETLAGGVGVSVVLAVFAGISLAADHGNSIWSQVAALVLMAPAATLGGWMALAMRRRRLRSDTSEAVPGRASSR
jgi:hypothetical protein